jgi:hypothetical protein
VLRSVRRGRAAAELAAPRSAEEADDTRKEAHAYEPEVPQNKLELSALLDLRGVEETTHVLRSCLSRP